MNIARLMLVRALRRSGDSPLRLSVSAFCSLTDESPDLPVWMNSSYFRQRKKSRTLEKEEEDVDDFELPTKLDFLGEWPTNSQADVRRIFPCELTIHAEKYNDNVVGDILRKAPFTSPAAVAQALNASCSVSMSKPLVDITLKRCSNDWVSAFGFFNWADSHSGYKHSADSYDMMVDILGKSMQFSLMWALIEEMFRIGGLVSLNTMSKAIRRLTRAGRWDDAIKAFHSVGRFGVRKDTPAMNVVLDALCKENSIRRAWDLFLQVRNDIPPDAKTFNTLIHGWCKARKFEEAKLTMEEMRKTGFDPCVISYTCLVEAYCMERNFCMADNILNEMLATGCPPNVVTYTIMFHSLIKAKQTEVAFQVYDRMKKNGCFPDVSFYNSIIYTFGRVGRLQDAYGVFAEMSNTRISPDTNTYNTLIAAACDHCDEGFALKLLQEMEQRFCEPDIRTFSSLLKIACKRKTVKFLKYIVDYMFQKGVSLDLGAYTLLIQGLCRNENLNLACKYFEEMILKGFLPRSSTCYMLTDKLERKKLDKSRVKIQQLMARAHTAARCEVLLPQEPLVVSTLQRI